MPALAVHSRSDGIVDWRACLDLSRSCVEIDGSHCGMAVNPRSTGSSSGLLDGRRGRMQAMSVQDAMFLHVENDVTPMHIGGVSIFEGPPPPFDELRAMVEGKLHLTPRYRQKVRFVPLGMGEPVWVDDPHFNIDYHLRHTAVPSPGTEEQLRATAARVFSQHLDRPEAAVGDLDGRGARGRPLGAALQGPPLHGRRRRSHRHDVPDVRGERRVRNGEVWQPSRSRRASS